MRIFGKAGEGDAGGGGAGGEGDTSKGLLGDAAAREAAAAAAAAGAVKPDDARAYLANYVADPEGLKVMAEPDLLKFHGRVKGVNDKAISEAVTKATASKGERPADVPEQFWDAATKTVNYGAWNKSLNDTRQELKKAKGQPDGAVPAAPEGYKLTPPADLPKHIATGDDDDAVKILRASAHKAGMTQAQFDVFAENYFRQTAAVLPPPIDVKAELAKLGKNGEKVVDTVLGWGKGMVSDGLLSTDEFDELFVMGSTAAGLRALNKIRERSGGAPIPVNSADGDGAVSADELYRLTTTDKYKNEPAERDRVTKLFEKTFGTAPAGTSAAGLGMRR